MLKPLRNLCELHEQKRPPLNPFLWSLQGLHIQSFSFFFWIPYVCIIILRRLRWVWGWLDCSSFLPKGNRAEHRKTSKWVWRELESEEGTAWFMLTNPKLNFCFQRNVVLVQTLSLSTKQRSAYNDGSSLLCFVNMGQVNTFNFFLGLWLKEKLRFLTKNIFSSFSLKNTKL